MGAASATGALLVAVVTLALGERARAWVIRRLGRDKVQRPDSLVQRVWLRFGIPGLGFLAPVAIGVALSIALGLSFGAPARRLFLWIVIGIVFWCTVLTAAGSLGLAGVRSLIP